MRIITINTNGIRSAANKGFFDWLVKQNADVVCVQETKSQEHQLDDTIFYPPGFHCYYFDAQKKGYSGTALFSRVEPKEVVIGTGWAPCDSEGRYIRAEFDKLSVVSLYMPSGSSGEERQAVKYLFLDYFIEHFRQLKARGKDMVLCADWNIAHTNKDIKNWRSNQKNSGFLPEERAWVTKMIEEEGWVDAFRVVNQQDEQYTWWSNRGQAWAKNVGWRLDYQLVTPGLAKKVKGEAIYKDQRFSDHAPLIMDYDFKLA